MQKFLPPCRGSAIIAAPFMRKTRKILLWLLPIFWASFIFWLSAQPEIPEIGPEFPAKDKAGHLLLYLILGWLVVRAAHRAHNLPLSKAALLGILLVSAYGAFDEWHQSWVPSRNPDVMDWATDTFAAALAAAIYWHDARTSQKTNR
jgi:VanZ family protein